MLCSLPKQFLKNYLHNFSAKINLNINTPYLSNSEDFSLKRAVLSHFLFFFCFFVFCHLKSPAPSVVQESTASYFAVELHKCFIDTKNVSRLSISMSVS